MQMQDVSFPPLEARTEALLSRPQLPTSSVSLETYFCGQHSIQSVMSRAIVWGRVQQTKVSKEEEVKQKYDKFWRGEKKGRYGPKKVFLLCLSQLVDVWLSPSPLRPSPLRPSPL